MNVGATRRGVVLFAAAAAFSAGFFPAAAVRAQTALKVTLDGRLDLTSAPLLMALERGYFKDEQLELAIEPSAGGTEPFARVAGGSFDIGIGDINAMIRYRDQNGPALKAVFVVQNRAAYAIIGRKSRGVLAPGDLVDKRLGLPAAEPASAAWPAFAKVNAIDPSKVRVVTVGVPVREPMLMAGEIDAAAGLSYGAPITLVEKGVEGDDISTLLMAAYGIELYGSSVFVNGKLQADKPEVLRAFLRAFARGLKDSVRDPAAAVAAVLRRGTGGSRDIELSRLTILNRDSIVTPDVKAKGLGGIGASRMESAIEQIALGYSFKTKPKPEDVFDPAFLPAEPERMLN